MLENHYGTFYTKFIKEVLSFPKLKITWPKFEPLVNLALMNLLIERNFKDISHHKSLKIRTGRELRILLAMGKKSKTSNLWFHSFQRKKSALQRISQLLESKFLYQ